MFSSLKKGFNEATTAVVGGATNLAHKVDKKISEVSTSDLLDNFRTGNVLQLVSRKSGRCLEIVMSPQGQLVVDGLGTEGPKVYHAHWTMLNEGKNTIHLHNNNNYLCMKNGTLYVAMFPNPQQLPPETRFRLHQMSATHICLESALESERNHHVGFLENGQIKSPVATGREIDAQFGVRLIYSAYPTPVQVTPQGQHQTQPKH